jgi:hypothetical protein
VLGIRDILVRIRILGSVPLSNRNRILRIRLLSSVTLRMHKKLKKKEMFVLVLTYMYMKNSKLKEKPQAVHRKHPALRNTKFLRFVFFYFDLCVFGPLGSASGSVSHPSTDPDTDPSINKQK